MQKLNQHEWREKMTYEEKMAIIQDIMIQLPGQWEKESVENWERCSYPSFVGNLGRGSEFALYPNIGEDGFFEIVRRYYINRIEEPMEDESVVLKSTSPEDIRTFIEEMMEVHGWEHFDIVLE
jgi:hypothetical protein